MKIYIDGTYYDRQDARISVFDHGLLYGDGVFEGLRVYDGVVFRLREHVERLYRSARAILLEIPMDERAMEAAVIEAVKTNNTTDGYIRLIVTRGEGALGLDPALCPKPTVVIIVGDIQLYPAEYYEKGIPVVTASSRRIPPDGLEPRIKSLNYLNNVLARIEARQAGCIEAVMLNADGFVAECTVGNIMIIVRGALHVPAPYHGALDGITMRTVMELARALGMAVTETTLSRYDLYNAHECLLTGTGAEIMPVVKIDGRVIGDGKPGPVTRLLTEQFRKAVRSVR